MYKYNLTSTKKDSLFTLAAIVFAVMLLIIQQAPLVLLDSLALELPSSFNKPSLDHMCFTCPGFPLEEYSIKGSISNNTLMNT